MHQIKQPNISNNKELLFSLTKKDFVVEYFIGSGKGGQHKQKTSTACRITHAESGASGTCQDHREQHRNRAKALQNLTKHHKFKLWIQKKIMEIDLGKTVENWVEEQMQPQFLKIERKNKEGKWEEWVDYEMET